MSKGWASPTSPETPSLSAATASAHWSTPWAQPKTSLPGPSAYAISRTTSPDYATHCPLPAASRPRLANAESNIYGKDNKIRAKEPSTLPRVPQAVGISRIHQHIPMTPPVPATLAESRRVPMSPKLNRHRATALPPPEPCLPAASARACAAPDSGGHTRRRTVTMGLMGAQESPPVPAGAVPPPEGMALGRLLALLGDGVSAEGLETQLAAMQ